MRPEIRGRYSGSDGFLEYIRHDEKIHENRHAFQKIAWKNHFISEHAPLPHQHSISRETCPDMPFSKEEFCTNSGSIQIQKMRPQKGRTQKIF
ncbi:MAG: hypothetical protein ABF824_09970 [Acetobacter sp.]